MGKEIPLSRGVLIKAFPLLFQMARILNMAVKTIIRDYFWGIGMAFLVAGLIVILPQHQWSEYVLIILGAIFLAIAVIHREK